MDHNVMVQNDSEYDHLDSDTNQKDLPRQEQKSSDEDRLREENLYPD